MELKNCAVIYNPQITNVNNIKETVTKNLSQMKINFECFSVDNLKKGFDLAFVFGGDGTILRAAEFYADTETVIFGINSGHLGFLSQTTEDEFINSLQKIKNGEYRIENRLMLEHNGKLALNDFVIKSVKSGKVSRFSVKINGQELSNYLADGLIISTPTGSTAYCLSANGPILSPNINAMVIVPICPHTLSARPLVVPSSEVISVSSSSVDNQLLLSADGSEGEIINGEITVKASEKNAKLLILNDKDFYSILQSKLNWGTPPNYC